MSTKTKPSLAPAPVVNEQPSQPSTAEEIVNYPSKVKAFGREYEVKRFSVGQLIRAMPHLAPLGYILRSASSDPDPAQMLVAAMQLAGEPALGLLSVAISEPVEWIEEQDDPIGGFELLVAVVEKNAAYFFAPENVDRLKAAFSRLQSTIQKHGGAISTP